MKYYSKKIIQDYIEQHKDEIEEVEVGMYEDWFWTAETIYNCNEGFSSILNTSDDRINVAGIRGSYWATPVMKAYIKNGDVTIISCFVDDGEKTDELEVNRLKNFCLATGGLDFVQDSI